MDVRIREIGILQMSEHNAATMITDAGLPAGVVLVALTRQIAHVSINKPCVHPRQLQSHMICKCVWALGIQVVA